LAHAIQVSNLTKRFGDVLAVDDLSFTVDEGRIVGFLGPNGAGKTTTLRMLLRLVYPTAGSSTIFGTDYHHLDDPVHKVGAVLDGGMLHPGRTGRNHLRALAKAAGVSAARTDELLQLVALTDPRVLVLDEPANGLDPQGIRWLRDFLRSLAREGRAMLVSSHVLAEVSQTADDVVVINRGRSVAQGTLTELIARSGGGMRVAGPDVRRLRELLVADGADVSGDGDIVVRDRSGEDIGRLIAANRLVVSELTPVGSSLEEVFFELTDAGGGPS
jgi:ABC-2 type transport system ATP-binding protein